MRQFSFILCYFISCHLCAQILPSSRGVDWTVAGLNNEISLDDFTEIDMEAMGIIGDGSTPNDSILNAVLSTLSSEANILSFPAGNFLFKQSISLPSNTIIKGSGATSSIFTMNLEENHDAFLIQGVSIATDTSHLIQSANKNNNYIIVNNTNQLAIKDWIEIVQEDSSLITSNWAKNTVGQIAKIVDISNDTIFLHSNLRMYYDINLHPFLKKITPKENVGIECIKIHRLDDTAPNQTSNINFTYAVNSWVKGIDSQNCTFSHIEANKSSNLYIHMSYFHEGFDYGGGGRAYGVMLQATSNECLVENNIFEHLRHSMILQSGANGNVFAYNYSLDPYWNSSPNDAAGDMVLHGNYPYANLFEQNIGSSIVIDNSHGANGPYNTFLRNRAEKYGIFFSADNSPSQNLIGNEITNNLFPYNLVNYTIRGLDHLVYGNYNKTSIHPSGTEALDDLSYTYSTRPSFLSSSDWAKIGTPNTAKSGSIPALDRYPENTIPAQACSITTSTLQTRKKNILRLFPNPARTHIQIDTEQTIQNISIRNTLGQLLYQDNTSHWISINNWATGLYFLTIELENGDIESRMFIKE